MDKRRESLDMYDKRPEAMVNYLSYYGWHFSKKMSEWAIENMHHEGKKSLSKEKVDELLKAYNIKLENDILYDKVFVANMLYHDLMNLGISDEMHLAKAIKAYLDDEDGYESIAFSRFYIDTIKKGMPISWDDML